MPTIKIEIEIALDRPVTSAEDERYLCASIEEGVSYGWYDFLMNEEVFPARAKSVRCRVLEHTGR